MSPISITAAAGLDITRRLALGELEVHGILLRETAGKRFRYILRGFEHLPADEALLNALPPLGPLRAALNATQLLQIVTIAQNAGLAATLRRIERRMDAIERRLTSIEQSLQRSETIRNLIYHAIRTQATSRLKASRTLTVVAWRSGNQTALQLAGKDAQQAFHDLLQAAQRLMGEKEHGVPVALRLPGILADLCENAADAAYISSDIWMELGNRDQAAPIMREAAEGLRGIRQEFANVLTSTDFLRDRMMMKDALDNELREVGQRLQHAMQWSIGRSLMIEQGVIIPDPERISSEHVRPTPELAFVPVRDVWSDSSG